MRRAFLLSSLASLIVAANPATAGPAAVAQPLQTIFNGTGLAGVSALAISADGRDLYAAGPDDRALVFFARNGGSGRLSRVATYHDSSGGVAGLAATARLLLDGDERTLYVAGRSGIAIYARDGDSGELRFVDLLASNFGISSILDIAISGETGSFYAVGSNALATFAAGGDGGLTHQETLRAADLQSLGGAYAVATSAGGELVFTASSGGPSISIFRAGGDALTLLDVVDTAGLSAPGDLVVAPGGAHLYATAGGEDQIAIFAIDASAGTLTPLGTLDDEPPQGGVAGPSRLAISADGRRLYVASATNGSVASVDRDPGSGALSFGRAVFDDRDGVLGIGRSSDIVLGPDETHVYVSGAADAAIGVFDAALSFLAVERNNGGSITDLQQPAAIAVAPDARHVYAASFSGGNLAIFARAADGTLTFAESYSGEGAGALSRPTSLAFNSDGSLLLIADFGAEAIHTLRRDPLSGSLTALATVDRSNGPADLRGVAFVTLSTDDTIAVALSLLSGSAILFNVMPDSHELVFRGTMPALTTPTAAVFAPDDSHLYTSSGGDDAVLAFARDDTSPNFPQLQIVRDGEMATDLIAPTALAINRNGDNLYVANGSGIVLVGTGSDSVVTLARDRRDGGLSFVDSQVEGRDGVSGIRGTSGVAVSPDGQLIAASGFAGGSIAIFERMPATGSLAFRQAHFDSGADTNGLAGASGLAFSPDGANLYVAGFGDSAVTAFSITPPRPQCPGDCAAAGGPSIGDIVRCVGFALSGDPPIGCFACDADGDGRIGIGDLIRTVDAALNGCP